MYAGTACYVGIGQCDTVDSDRFIVSDGFASCVPVVAMHGDTTSLAHCDSAPRVDEIVGGWDRDDTSVIVIQKAMNATQTVQSEAIPTFAKFQALGFRYVTTSVLPVNGPLGVIVRGDVVLAYRQA